MKRCRRAGTSLLGTSRHRAWAGLVLRAVGLVLGADRRGLLAAAALQLLGAAAAVGVVLSSHEALGALLAPSGDGSAQLVVAMLALAVTTTLAGSAGAVQGLQMRVLGERVSQGVWTSLLRSTAAVDLLTYEDHTFLRDLDRVRSHAVGRPFAVVSSLLTLAGSVLGTVVLTGALVALQPLLVPVLLAAGIPAVLISRRTSRAEYAFAREQNPLLAHRGYLTMLLTHRVSAGELRAFQVVPALERRRDLDDRRHLAALRRHVRHRMLEALLTVGAAGGCLAVALLVIVALLRSGHLGLADAGAAAIAARLLSGQLSTVFRSIGSLVESAPFLAELEQFTSAHPPREPAGARQELATDLRLDGVSFTYPGSSVPAVAEASVRLERGSVVAVVGENGSGKSTLAKLLAGLYEPTRGRVRWDGADIDGSDQRASVTVLFQEFMRYQMSVADNVAMSESELPVDRESIESCLRRVGVLDAVRALPRGLDTVLGLELEDGADLSGGQWQRVALARALYRDAPVVVLDEPTAAMDPRAEHELFSDVRTVLDGRAALLISHRYSSVRLADYIYVMDAGRVVEEGTHEQLMALGGRYSELYALQAEAYAS